MLRAFKPAHYSHTHTEGKYQADEHCVWFFLFKARQEQINKKKKKTKELYSSQKNRVWGSGTLRKQKALLFAK